MQHSTFYGTVRFEEEKYQLKNESLKIYSNDYDTNVRRLKIMTNTLVGDVEVSEYDQSIQRLIRIICVPSTFIVILITLFSYFHSIKQNQ